MLMECHQPLENNIGDMLLASTSHVGVIPPTSTHHVGKNHSIIGHHVEIGILCEKGFSLKECYT